MTEKNERIETYYDNRNPNFDYTNKYMDKAKEIAGIVKEKNKAYGNSFKNSTEIIKILYPAGIKPDQYQDFLTIIRVLDKLSRIANKKDAFGENPWMDICGYALLSVIKEEK